MPEDPYLLSKMVYHFGKLQDLKDGKPIAPTNIQIDLEAYCNDNCSFCSYRAEESHNAKGMLGLINASKLPMIDNKPMGQPTSNSSLPLEFAETLPKQLKEAGIPSITMTGGGESTLWKGYDLFVDNLIKNGIEIGLITNGSTINEKRANEIASYFRWVRFSMDACTPETHQRIHRTTHQDFERRIANLTRLVTLRQVYNRMPTKEDEGLTIGVNFVVTDTNVDEIEKAAEFYSKTGIDYIRFSFMYIDGVGVGQITQENIQKALQSCKTSQKYSREGYQVLAATYKIDTYTKYNDDFNTCYMQRFVWALAADCKVYPCCIQKYIPGWELADIREMSLMEMIQKTHEKMSSLDVKACPPCWMRDRNKSVEHMMNSPKHVNFV